MTEKSASEAAAAAERMQLQSEYQDCLLSHWKLCAAGLAIGLPVAMKTRKHIYWAIGGISGTMLDYVQALEDCKGFRARIASVDLKSGVRDPLVASAGMPVQPVPESSDQQA
eukprot:CAMPEP_0202036564 /NCGR_PEP_ID=MMETSP0962-20130828/1627_1 /ASSEMBLY_ACC=CAM_ASM_000488 /TAXON_ID=4773 /ORGANISM="Schizochytrium aggregatum, Strain ATCC28209" /LENGTH=111 /DNA_ID=CAMNT_0048600643 /DNA_START=12 /DNA_END=347 /DNA_ORIENTATION=-